MTENEEISFYFNLRKSRAFEAKAKNAPAPVKTTAGFFPFCSFLDYSKSPPSPLFDSFPLFSPATGLRDAQFGALGLNILFDSQKQKRHYPLPNSADLFPSFFNSFLLSFI